MVTPFLNTTSHNKVCLTLLTIIVTFNALHLVSAEDVNKNLINKSIGNIKTQNKTLLYNPDIKEIIDALCNLVYVSECSDINVLKGYGDDDKKY